MMLISVGEFIDTVDWIALGTGIAGIITAIASLIAVLVGIRKNHQVTEALSEAKMRETYVVCPHCRTKIPLSEIDFHLPSGAIDNNLNGKPDYLDS